MVLLKFLLIILVKLFIDYKSVDKLVNDFLDILSLKVDMCFIDEDDNNDDSQTEEFITMTKTLDHVLKLICEAKLNKREIKNYINKEINKARKLNFNKALLK